MIDSDIFKTTLSLSDIDYCMILMALQNRLFGSQMGQNEQGGTTYPPYVGPFFDKKTHECINERRCNQFDDL